MKKKLTKKHIQIILFSFLFMSIVFTMMGIWAVDIGVSGMVINAQNPHLDIIATNGWWVRPPVQQYHIGLWLIGIGMLIIIYISIFVIVNIEVDEK